MGLFGIVLIIMLIVLFFIFPKQMLSIGLVIVLLSIILWWIYIETPQKQRDALNKSVVVGVVYSVSSCKHGLPLLVSIKNNSYKTVAKVSWYISIYIPGYSTDISGSNNRYSSDKILKPGEALTSCYALPLHIEADIKAKNKDLSALRYVISNKYIEFED
jgi:hypothetical protein